MHAIEFPVGLPGFPGRRSFHVEHMGPAPLVRLSATDASFVMLTEPASFFPDIAPMVIDDDTLETLGVGDSSAVVVWLILTVSATSVTANLLGPVVVNRDNGLAAQVVVRDLSAPVSAPLSLEAARCSS